MDNRPIGVFDSGMGGLTVRTEISRSLPGESLVYFGDGKNVPYGPRPKEEIASFARNAVDRLMDNGAKIIVIACNAATGAAIEQLRASYDIPFIGMEPAVKPAALSTKTGIIGVLATAAAFRGELYKTTAGRFRDKVRIIETVGEGFVELVENDLEDTPESYETVCRAVLPMLEAGADHIVLGCTHYPYLAGQIERVITEFSAETGSPAAIIVDSAPAIARRVEQILVENDLCAAPNHIAQHKFLSFADNEYLEHLVRKSDKQRCR